MASLHLTSNRTTGRTSNRVGAGCLALFALPFAAVGVGAFVWAVATLVAPTRRAIAARMRPAFIASSVERKRNSDCAENLANGLLQKPFP